MQAHVLHFPMPDPAPQPQPIPYPTAPPPPEPGSPLPLPMVYMAPVWRYKHVQRSAADVARFSETELDGLGAEGWELAGVTTEGETTHFFFKRPAR